ncbi:hypothetical protein B7463_g4044, partial [Scytalidium lignicola]
MPTPEETYKAFTEQKKRLDASGLESIVNKLKPATINLLTRDGGEWRGGDFDTGNPSEGELAKIRWAGKTFHSADDVEPIVLYNAKGERVWAEEFGRGSLQMVERNGMKTTGLVYENRPIVDFFYYVNDNMVAGVMDNGELGRFARYHYYLYK